MNNVAFLDRDGVINVDIGYIWEKEKFIWKPDIELAIRLLNQYYKVIVVTNQGGIRKGLYTDLQLNRLHNWVNSELDKRNGAHIDAFYYCPHHNIDNCDCRKPKPGLLLEAIEDWDADLKTSFMIGDNEWDEKAAKSAGIEYYSVKKQYIEEFSILNLVTQLLIEKQKVKSV
jgi:D-glycero-D-manno-heptose 1,7-bisphosphate phosphatase